MDRAAKSSNWPTIQSYCEAYFTAYVKILHPSTNNGAVVSAALRSETLTKSVRVFFLSFPAEITPPPLAEHSEGGCDQVHSTDRLASGHQE